MALSLVNANIARQKSYMITRDPTIFYALKAFFLSWACNHRNADIRLINYNGSDTDNSGGFDTEISEAHRVYAVWGKKPATDTDSYLVGFDSASGGGAGSGPPLGDAGRFAILAGTPDITNTGSSVVIGDIGIHPAASVTGFPPGIVVDGEIHLADSTAAAGKAALVVVYDALAALPSTETLAPGVVIGTGGTRPAFTAGVYDWATAGQLTGAVTLTGSATDVFVFRTGTTMITAAASSVVLAGGALAQNVFWKVGSSATLGTTTAMIGNVIALTSITANTGATVAGRLLARNGTVTLDSNGGTWVAGAGGSGLLSNADGRFSIVFPEAGKEAIAIWPNGIPMTTNLILKTYTTFDGPDNSEAGDSPNGFVIVGANIITV